MCADRSIVVAHRVEHVLIKDEGYGDETIKYDLCYSKGEKETYIKDFSADSDLV